MQCDEDRPISLQDHAVQVVNSPQFAMSDDWSFTILLIIYREVLLECSPGLVGFPLIKVDPIYLVG